MKTAAIGMVGVLLLAGGLSAQKTPSFSVRNGEIFTGEITDSFCAEDGHHLRVIKSREKLHPHVRQVRGRAIRAL